DLTEHGRDVDLAQSGDFVESLDDSPRGITLLRDVRIELGYGRFERLDQAEMHPKQTPLLRREPSLKSFFQAMGRRFQARMSQGGELFRVGLSANQRDKDLPAAHAQHLAHRACQLDAGDVECFLDALRMAVDFTHELLPCARELPQRADFCGGNEAASDEPVGMKVC